MAMRVWLIRHGLTWLSEEGRYQGCLDEGLSPRGRETLCPAEFQPDQVYVSPALRARETAEILFPAAKQIVIHGLREMDFGLFDGHGWWELGKNAEYLNWVNGGCSGRCPAGEDRAEYTARVCAAMENILQNESDECTVVAHGGTMMAALERWGRPSREYWKWQRPCGCGWLLNWNGKSAALQVLNEVSFLR